MGRAHVLQQLEMRPDRIHFGADVLLVAAAIIPARNHGKAMTLHDRLQLRRVARKLAAKFGAGIARLLGFAQANLKRRVAAEFRHVVIAPGDRVDANANLHERPPLLIGCGVWVA